MKKQQCCLVSGRKIAISSILLFIMLTGFCQEKKHLFSISNSDIAPQEWKAKWIWIENLSYQETNVFMLARKTFHLESIPSMARIYITATDHYKLWINGEFINRGPIMGNGTGRELFPSLNAFTLGTWFATLNPGYERNSGINIKFAI